MVKIFATLMLFCVFLHSEERGLTLFDDDSGEIKPDLALNQEYLKLFDKKNKLRDLRDKTIQIESELDGTAELSESLVPLVKRLSTIDVIYVHPRRSLTILLPSSAKITYIKPTFGARILEYDRDNPSNVFILQVDKEFTSGNMDVFFVVGDEKKLLKLRVETYRQRPDDKTQMLYSVIDYREPAQIQDIDVLAAFKKEFGFYPKEKISFINMNGVVYKIIEDNNYGSILSPSGKKYRLVTQQNTK